MGHVSLTLGPRGRRLGGADRLSRERFKRPARPSDERPASERTADFVLRPWTCGPIREHAASEAPTSCRKKHSKRAAPWPCEQRCGLKAGDDSREDGAWTRSGSALRLVHAPRLTGAEALGSAAHPRRQQRRCWKAIQAGYSHYKLTRPRSASSSRPGPMGGRLGMRAIVAWHCGDHIRSGRPLREVSTELTYIPRPGDTSGFRTQGPPLGSEKRH